jgi:hypothetical protein
VFLHHERKFQAPLNDFLSGSNRCRAFCFPLALCYCSLP